MRRDISQLLIQFICMIKTTMFMKFRWRLKLRIEINAGIEVGIKIGSVVGFVFDPEKVGVENHLQLADWDYQQHALLLG